MTTATSLVRRPADRAHSFGGGALDHEALVGLARQVRAAADSHDPERFEREIRRFLTELTIHLRSESHDLSGLPDDRQEALARGQQDLVAMATALADADPRCPGISLSRPARVLVGALQGQRYEEHRSLIESGGGAGQEVAA